MGPTAEPTGGKQHEENVVLKGWGPGLVPRALGGEGADLGEDARDDAAADDDDDDAADGDPLIFVLQQTEEHIPGGSGGLLKCQRLVTRPDPDPDPEGQGALSSGSLVRGIWSVGSRVGPSYTVLCCWVSVGSRVGPQY